MLLLKTIIIVEINTKQISNFQEKWIVTIVTNDHDLDHSIKLYTSPHHQIDQFTFAIDL